MNKPGTWTSFVERHGLWTAAEEENARQIEQEVDKRGIEVMPRPPVEGLSGERWLVHPKSSNGVMVEAI